MFLNSMANPSSCLEVIHFLLSHQSFSQVEACIISAKCLWHQVWYQPATFVNSSYTVTSHLVKCSKTKLYFVAVKHRATSSHGQTATIQGGR